MKSIKRVIFAGPSLNSESKKIISERSINHDTLLFEPAEAGSIWNTLATYAGVHQIVIIDGYFYERKAVLHREILCALESGVEVIGASSLGALRAVELANFGMVGYGKVYNYISENPMIADDEVCLLHTIAPELEPITIPLINLRLLVDSKVFRDHRDLQLIKSIIEKLQKRSFVDRSWDLVRQEFFHVYGKEAGQAKYSYFKDNVYVDFKSIDCQNLLAVIFSEHKHSGTFRLKGNDNSCKIIKDLGVEDHGIGLSYLRFVPMNVSQIGIDEYSVQQLLSSLRLSGLINKELVANTIFKDQIYSRYNSSDPNTEDIEKIVSALLDLYNCSCIEDLSHKLGLPRIYLEKLMAREACYQHYLKEKLDEYSLFKMNQLLHYELIVRGFYISEQFTSMIPEILNLKKLASIWLQVSKLLGLEMGIRTLRSLTSKSVLDFVVQSSVTRYQDVITMLKLLARDKETS